MKAGAVSTSASTGSNAVTEADRGRPSMAARSPSSAPGPRRASTTSPPNSVSEYTFTRPDSRMITTSDGAPSVNRAAPRGQCRRPPRRRSSSISSNDSSARNSCRSTAGPCAPAVMSPPRRQAGPEPPRPHAGPGPPCQHAGSGRAPHLDPEKTVRELRPSARPPQLARPSPRCSLALHLSDSQELVRPHSLLPALDLQVAEGPDPPGRPDGGVGGGAHHHLAGLRHRLQPGRDVHRVPHRVEVPELIAADVADQGRAGVDPDPEQRRAA